MAPGPPVAPCMYFVLYTVLTWPPPAPRCAEWHQSHTWFSTEPPQRWPWTCSAAALLSPPVPPRTVLLRARSHDAPTANHEPGHSLPEMIHNKVVK